MPIPTRWRTAVEDQIADGEHRVGQARGYLSEDEDGRRALQTAYQAVVAAATVRVWIIEPPWQQAGPPEGMQRRVQQEFPNRFAALASLELRDVLTSGWTLEAVTPYVDEAAAFIEETRGRVTAWLENS